MLSLPSFNKRCRVGQGVKTPPFHGGVTGSIPVRGTEFKTKALIVLTIRAFLILKEFDNSFNYSFFLHRL